MKTLENKRLLISPGDGAREVAEIHRMIQEVRDELEAVESQLLRIHNRGRYLTRRLRVLEERLIFPLVFKLNPNQKIELEEEMDDENV